MVAGMNAGMNVTSLPKNGPRRRTSRDDPRM
jgi:hypothetical protein